MAEIAQLHIRDLTEQIPHNPERPKIPIRRVRPTHIVLHCDDAAAWGVWDLINYDLKPNHLSTKGCPCPTYAYYISRAGKVYKIAQECYETWHAGVNALVRKLYRIPDWNNVGIAVCFAHKPGMDDGLTPEQIEVGQLLVAEITSRRDIQSANVLGHRELAGSGHKPGRPDLLRKTCPGMDVDLHAFRSEVRDLKLDIASGRLKIEVKSA